MKMLCGAALLFVSVGMVWAAVVLGAQVPAACPPSQSGQVCLRVIVRDVSTAQSIAGAQVSVDRSGFYAVPPNGYYRNVKVGASHEVDTSVPALYVTPQRRAVRIDVPTTWLIDVERKPAR